MARGVTVTVGVRLAVHPSSAEWGLWTSACVLCGPICF